MRAAVINIEKDTFPPSEGPAWPCPFCGSPARQCDVAGADAQEVIIGCFNPRCQVAPRAQASTPGKALWRWNHRSPLPQHPVQQHS